MRGRAALWPVLVTLPVAVTLLVYSQWGAFAWDEGFHVLAAQLIALGKRPYIDFVFPQAPLNAWITALALRLFGESWRVPHALQALAASGAVYLAADYVYRRMPDPRWKIAAALSTALLTGLNAAVVEYATVGQAYGMCLLLSIVAFRLAAGGTVMLAGLSSGAAAASSLLSAPLLPVLAAWFWLRSGARAAAGFIAAALIPFLPIAWLFAEAPRRTWFNIGGFQLLYRKVQWANWPVHDLDIDTAWATSPQALLLIGLSLACLVLVRRSGWDAGLKKEIYLCGAVAAAQSLYLVNIHPGFTRYYLLAAPFAGILSGLALGLLGRARGVWWPVAAIGVVMSISLARYLVEDSNDFNWPDFEQIGRCINRVTPPGGSVYADEHAYFTARRVPPEGMSFNYSHKVELPAAEAKALGIVSHTELDRETRAHAFATFESCEEEDEITRLGLAKIYSHRANIGNCSVFW